MEAAASSSTKRKYLFRGDDTYLGGSVGRALGSDADAADIQDPAEHVLRKDSKRSSRYTSFTEEVKIARKFTTAQDNSRICKAELAELRNLESAGTIRIFDPERVYHLLLASGKKLAKRAADVRAAMRRNNEILLEGQIPVTVLEPVN